MAEGFNFNWVSPFHPDDGKGGWKGMQFHLLRTLEAKLGPACRIAPIDVAEDFAGKWLSRIQKQLRMPRQYAYYSESRLNAFGRQVDEKLLENAGKPVVFFGPLPFVKSRPKSPYFIYTDGAFFIHYWEYNQDHTHDRKDIERIARAEALFMQRAERVWCSSQLVADRITREYAMEPGKAIFVGTGPGNVPPPVPEVSYDHTLVMISGDFERKGGRLAVDAVAEARRLGAEIRLKFIGTRPPDEVLKLPFVEWCGWLDLGKEPDRNRFAEVMSGVGAQILLSRSDLTPLVITEAAKYGKATVAAAVGGIPEMIENGRTGWLVNPDGMAPAIGERLAALFKDDQALAEIGGNARRFCEANWSWEAVGRRCCATISAARGEGKQ